MAVKEVSRFLFPFRSVAGTCDTGSRLCATTASAGGQFLGVSAAGVALASTARAAGKPGDAKAGRQGRQGRAVPEGLRLGRRDRVIPGRGRRQRGRPRAVGLGHVLQEEGGGVRGQHGRHRVRPLPPLQGRRRADEDAGREVVPLQRVVDARAAERHRRGQRQGPGFLQPPARRAGQGGHHADVHDLPLGLPGGAVQARRLAEPRLRRLVRRVHRAARRQAVRSGEAVGDAERAPVLHRSRAPRRRARAGRQAEVRRLPAGRRTTACAPTPSRCRRCARTPRIRRRRRSATCCRRRSPSPPATSPRTSRRRARRRSRSAAATNGTTPGGPIRWCWASTRRTASPSTARTCRSSSRPTSTR